MKKSTFIYAAGLSLMAALPSVTMAAGPEIKAGLGSVKAANDKAGFDAGIAYSYNIERFFAFVPEINFNWINFDQCTTTPCTTATIGGLTSTLTTTRNHYTLPLILNVRFIVPMGSEETPAVQPYVTVGAGYAWSFFKAETPAYTDANGSKPAQTENDSASGFMYQGMLGLQFNLGMLTEGSASATSLLLEVGYRGGQVEKSGFKFDMSGYVVRAGASFNF
jgi:outer membrane protein W